MDLPPSTACSPARRTGWRAPSLGPGLPTAHKEGRQPRNPKHLGVDGKALGRVEGGDAFAMPSRNASPPWRHCCATSCRVSLEFRWVISGRSDAG